MTIPTAALGGIFIVSGLILLITITIRIPLKRKKRLFLFLLSAGDRRGDRSDGQEKYAN